MILLNTETNGQQTFNYDKQINRYNISSDQMGHLYLHKNKFYNIYLC